MIGNIVKPINKKSSTSQIIKIYEKWESKTWNGLTSFYGYNVWTDGDNIYLSFSSSQYILDKSTSTWNIKKWNNVGDSYNKGECVWTDGVNTYLSNNNYQYILIKYYILN